MTFELDAPDGSTYTVQAKASPPPDGNQHIIMLKNARIARLINSKADDAVQWNLLINDN